MILLLAVWLLLPFFYSTFFEDISVIEASLLHSRRYIGQSSEAELCVSCPLTSLTLFNAAHFAQACLPFTFLYEHDEDLCGPMQYKHVGAFILVGHSVDMCPRSWQWKHCFTWNRSSTLIRFPHINTKPLIDSNKVDLIAGETFIPTLTQFNFDGLLT